MMVKGRHVEVSEVRIKLVDRGAERLLAFCSITIDGAFVVRDLKLIDGPNGPFVAMPSRKIASHCPSCRAKNPLRSNYCNQCGTRLAAGPPAREDDGRQRLYADIAHPINAACRDQIQRRVVAEYETELIRAREPGYVSRYEAVGDEEIVR
ncbi:MAG: septation protein SpoVG family protein [Planctomycetaceae bacterium]